MAYNKAREERKWRLWKEAEEKQLRSLGISEGDIEKLRVHDWAVFNSDRRYYEKLQKKAYHTRNIDTQKMLNMEQVLTLIEASRETPIHMQVLFAVLLGLR